MALSFEKLLTPDEHARLKVKVRELSRIEPWRAYLALALDWLAVAATIIAVERLARPLGAAFFVPAYLLGVFFIASRQHALAILAHEAAHYRLLASKAGNTRLANWFVAYPLFFQVEVYRLSHLLHHQHTNLPQDPDVKFQAGQRDWSFPMPASRLLRIFLLDLLGKGMLANFRRAARFNADPEFATVLAPELARTRWIRLAYYAALALALSLAGGWRVFLLYWIVPSMWIFPSFLRLRNLSEHYGLTWESDLQGTRDVACSWLEGWLIAPHFVRLHLVHHLYPSIPFYRLPELRAHLLDYRAFIENAHANSSYVIPRRDAVWREVVRVTPLKTG